MASRLLPIVGAIGALGIATACAIDSASAPTWATRVSSKAAPAGGLGRDQQRLVRALSRSGSLDHDVSATVAIGTAGGTIVIPEAGVTIVFPRGAVRGRTSITVTAKAGSAVAYEFEPHGLTFDAPVQVSQDLSYTSLGVGRLTRIQAGYYQQTLDAILLGSNMSLAAVTERRDVDLDDPVRPRIATFYISHFSGYIMWTGFADGGGADSSLPH